MSDDDAWHRRRRTLWERDAGLCGFCGDPVDLLEMDLDHIIPKADGGSNDDSNLRVAHRLCNRLAGARTSSTHRRFSPRTRRMNKDDADREAEIAISLRLRVDLHKFLCELARAENRSLNSQIVFLLEQFADLVSARYDDQSALCRGHFLLPRPAL